MVNFIKNSDDEYTPRELVKHAFEHKETPRIPFSFGLGINYPVKSDLLEYLRFTDMQQLDDYLIRYEDFRQLHVPYIGPSDKFCSLPDGSYVDAWGVKRSPINYSENGTYHEISYYPMAGIKNVSQLDDFAWPHPDWFDYSAVPEILKEINPDGQYAVKLGNGNVFETSWYMRGLEQMMIDFIDDPDLVYAIFERVTDFYITYFDRTLRAANGQVDVVFTADDIAGQRGLMFSPQLWKEQLVPWHKKLNERLHEHGVKIMYHTDGAAHSVIEDMIKMGIDAWEAVQMDADGMDARKIKKAAAGRLAIHGGISVQQLLPFGTPDEVRSEISYLIKVFSTGGGYIPAPAHAIQAGTPPENVIAMLDTVRPDL